MSQIIDILNGHLKELVGNNEELSQSRLEICKQCPLLTNNELLGLICSSSKYLNPKTMEVSTTPRKDFIRGCNCRMKAKSRLPNSHCIAGLW